MGIGEIRDALMWCTIINSGVLVLWFAMFALAGDLIYRHQVRWFTMSREAFDMANYAGMGLFKLAIIFLNAVPFLVLRIAG